MLKILSLFLASLVTALKVRTEMREEGFLSQTLTQVSAEEA